MHKKFQNNMILFLQRKVLYTKLKSKISMNLLKNRIGICTAFLEENNKHGVRISLALADHFKTFCPTLEMMGFCAKTNTPKDEPNWRLP